jgi:DNA-binding PadR family transcriptional regulator
LRQYLRKLRAHGLIERDGKRYAYRLTEKGNKVALLFVLFHKRVCGPLANSLFNGPSKPGLMPPTRIEAAYRRAD